MVVVLWAQSDRNGGAKSNNSGSLFSQVSTPPLLLSPSLYLSFSSILSLSILLGHKLKLLHILLRNFSSEIGLGHTFLLALLFSFFFLFIAERAEFQSFGKMSKREGKIAKKERVKSKKRKSDVKEVLIESSQVAIKDEKIDSKAEKRKKSLSVKKRKKEKGSVAIEKADHLGSECEDGSVLRKDEKIDFKAGKRKRSLSLKKRKKEKGSVADSEKADQLGSECEDGPELQRGATIATESNESEAPVPPNNFTSPQEANRVDNRNEKPSKSRKKKKKGELSCTKDHKSKERSEAVANEIYHISAGDEDSSKGMKKWIMEYHIGRPGLKVLQDRIDEFMTAHEEREEQARKERDARAADGGWTVVMHHKGRKKSTDAESGITVGSVAQAAVMDKMSKKKSKEVGLDFYRFQKREAHRNEIMMLQSKFEQDKKRIQQLRAARKFRPY